MATDDLLTEGEIDALMESVDDTASADAGADDGQYRRFDFGAREQALLREFTALRPLLERQADLLGLALEDAFTIDFTTRAEAPALLPVADVLASLGTSLTVTTATLAPLAGPVYVISPAPLLSFVVNAYFGGGVGEAAQVSRSTLTPSEIHLAERLADLTLESLISAWTEKLTLEAGDAKTLDIPDRLEMLPRDDLLLRLGFELSAGVNTSTLQLLLPFAALEPYRSRFRAPSKKESAELGQSWEPYFRRELPLVEVELAAVLASRSISIADLTQLAEGMVLPLPPPETVRLRVGDVTLAEGRYGSFEGAKAVQIERLGDLNNRHTG